MDVGERTMTA